VRLLIPTCCLIALTLGCGGGSGGGATPTTPSTPAATNRAPIISSASVSPASGISTLTTHSFAAAASDPDGDALTYSWDFGNGATSSSSTASVTYNNANTTTLQATVTVTDSKGATATANVSVTSATIAGTFVGTLQGSPMTTTLTQFLGGVVTGTWQQPAGSGEVGPTGELGKILANGQFDLRFKVKQGSFNDFYYRGTMDPTGQRLTGSVTGSGFTGQLMQLEKR
jgi:hypothetical protein